MKKLLPIVQCFIPLTNAAFSTAASIERKTVTLGDIGYHGSFYPDENGKMTRYGVAYLLEKEKHSNLKSEYVFSAWLESLQRFDSGEMNLKCTAKKTYGHMGKHGMSEPPLSSVIEMVYTLPSGRKLNHNDYTAINDLRLACYAKKDNVMGDIDVTMRENSTLNPYYRDELLEKYFGMDRAVKDSHFTFEKTEFVQSRTTENGEMAVRIVLQTNMNPLFFSMLNKAISVISVYKYNKIEIENINGGYSSELFVQYFLCKFKYMIIVLNTVINAIIFAVL